MESKKYTWQQRLAYLYLAFAEITDGDLSNEELKTIKEKLVHWGGEEQDMIEFRNTMSEALQWYRGNKDLGYRVDNVIDIAESLVHQPWFDSSFRLRLIRDLIDLALVDGKLHETEKNWISRISIIWDTDIKI